MQTLVKGHAYLHVREPYNDSLAVTIVCNVSCNYLV